MRYFKRKEPIYFSYRDKLYSILIRNVQCYPQAFAAAAMILGELAPVPRALILDVGGFTADYLLLENGRADLRARIEELVRIAHVGDRLQLGVVGPSLKSRFGIASAGHVQHAELLHVDALIRRG